MDFRFNPRLLKHTGVLIDPSAQASSERREAATFCGLVKDAAALAGFTSAAVGLCGYFAKGRFPITGNCLMGAGAVGAVVSREVHVLSGNTENLLLSNLAVRAAAASNERVLVKQVFGGTLTGAIFGTTIQLSLS